MTEYWATEYVKSAGIMDTVRGMIAGQSSDALRKMKEERLKRMTTPKQPAAPSFNPAAVRAANMADPMFGTGLNNRYSYTKLNEHLIKPFGE